MQSPVKIRTPISVPLRKDSRLENERLGGHQTMEAS
jgi:hypothetical protein